jgi:lipopolysaccharide export system protein LptA
VKPIFALLLALALPSALPAAAQNIDMTQGGPVDITSNDGIEWRQEQRVVIARGNARAIRDGVTVDAARLLARYRPQAGTQPAAAPGAADSPLSGGNEIWRLEAEGNVLITTATDVATGDRGVYDMDQAVLVLTGRQLTLTTPNQHIVARDSLEYWSQRRMAVARGNAVLTTKDNRYVGADTLVSYLTPEGTPAPVRSATPGAAAPPPGSGRIDRVELFGNVEIRTETEVVRGDRGVYSAETGLARILGNVRITRGDNQVNGTEALVNFNTGISRLVNAPGARVRGLIVPQQQQQQRATPPTGMPQ